MLKIKASKTTLRILCGTAALLFIGCIYIYINRSAKLKEMDKQLKQAQNCLADNQAVISQLDAVESNYHSITQKLAILENGVSSKAYVPTLLKQLETLGQKNHLHVVSVRPQPADAPGTVPAPPVVAGKGATAAPPYDKLNVDIEVNGSYKNAAHFIYELTSFPKIIAVHDLQISPLVDNKSAEVAPLSVKFNVTAFIMKEPSDKTGSKGVQGTQLTQATGELTPRT